RPLQWANLQPFSILPRNRNCTRFGEDPHVCAAVSERGRYSGDQRICNPINSCRSHPLLAKAASVRGVGCRAVSGRCSFISPHSPSNRTHAELLSVGWIS